MAFVCYKRLVTYVTRLDVDFLRLNAYCKALVDERFTVDSSVLAFTHQGAG